MKEKTLKICYRYLDELIKSGLNIGVFRFTQTRLYYFVNDIEEYININKLTQAYKLIDETNKL